MGNATSAIKGARPDAGRAIEHDVADGPAQRVAAGEPAQDPGQVDARSRTDQRTVVTPDETGDIVPPSSRLSYSSDPSKVHGGTGADPDHAPGEPTEDKAHNQPEAKPVGADPDASPGFAPIDHGLA